MHVSKERFLELLRSNVGRLVWNSNDEAPGIIAHIARMREIGAALPY